MNSTALDQSWCLATVDGKRLTCMYRCSLKAIEVPYHCLRCTERLNIGLAAQKTIDIKMQSSTKGPQQEWEEFSALAAPFWDHKNCSCGFVSVLLGGNPIKMKPSLEQVTEGDNKQT